MYRMDWVNLVLDKDGDTTAKEKLFVVCFVCIWWNWSNPTHGTITQLVTHSTYFGSVILRISLQSRPINVTDSSTGVNFGIGI